MASKTGRASWTRPSRPLAQTVSVCSADKPQPKPPQTARFPPHQRRCRCAPIRLSVPVREDRHTPHQRRCRAHRVGRPGPGPGGRLPTHVAGLFRCSREPMVSLPRRSRARRPSRCQTASVATLHSFHSFRALGHWETHCRRPQSRRTHPAVNETPSNQG